MAQSHSRELVFTTLIDLLVQMIFILAIVLVVLPMTNAKEPEEHGVSGDVDADPWQTLRAVAFNDTSQRDRNQVIAKVQQIKRERDEFEERSKAVALELEKLKSKSRAAKNGEGSAPGLERCVVDGRRGRPLFRVVFSAAGTYHVLPAAQPDGGAEYQALSKVLGAQAGWADLKPRLEPVWKAGRDRDCTFVVDWSHEAGLDGDRVLAGRANLEQMFYLTRPLPVAHR